MRHRCSRRRKTRGNILLCDERYNISRGFILGLNKKSKRSNYPVLSIATTTLQKIQDQKIISIKSVRVIQKMLLGTRREENAASVDHFCNLALNGIIFTNFGTRKE
jgi:hypothetical protein